jgi:hypothetical protein
MRSRVGIMNFKTSQTASKRSSRMNVPHGLKSTSLRSLGTHPKLGSDSFVEDDPALLVRDRTFDLFLFVAHYRSKLFLVSVCFPCAQGKCMHSRYVN